MMLGIISTRKSVLKDLAASFLFDMGEEYDAKQRVVLEVMDPDNRDRTRRLDSSQTIEEAEIEDGMVLRVFPEAIAGIVDEQERLERLIRDHKKMKELAGWHPYISFSANMTHAPTQYTVIISCKGFKAISKDGEPQYSDDHKVEITLGAEYPWKPPRVKWLSPISHPNIRNGNVCLGILMEQYPPQMNLARLVIMLSEMAIYQNFDMTNALNKEVAEWAVNPVNWDFIRGIGGSPFQGPLAELLKSFKGENEPRKFQFKPIPKG